MNYTFWIVAGKRSNGKDPKFAKGIGTAGIVFAFPEKSDAEAYQRSCTDADSLAVFEMTAVSQGAAVSERPIEAAAAKE